MKNNNHFTKKDYYEMYMFLCNGLTFFFDEYKFNRRKIMTETNSSIKIDLTDSKNNTKKLFGSNNVLIPLKS